MNLGENQSVESSTVHLVPYSACDVSTTETSHGVLKRWYIRLLGAGVPE